MSIDRLVYIYIYIATFFFFFNYELNMIINKIIIAIIISIKNIINKGKYNFWDIELSHINSFN